MAEQVILAKEVEQLPLDPKAPEWQRAKPVEVPLSAQVIVKPRVYEASVTRLRVRSLYDQERIGFLLEWQDTARDLGIGRVTDFRDAVAIQFPEDPSPPIAHFAMGEPGNPVIIYQWKADWQSGPDYDVDESFPNMWADFYPYAGRPPGEIVEGADYATQGQAPWPAMKAFNTALGAGNPLADPALKRKTPVEKLTAAGFGSLTHQKPEEQDGLGNGAHDDNGWQVVMAIPRGQSRFQFLPGSVVPIAFAVWDGAKGERGAEKAVATWLFVALEKATGGSIYYFPALVAILIGAMQGVILRRLRQARRP